jgi:hypothetical protein
VKEVCPVPPLFTATVLSEIVPLSVIVPPDRPVPAVMLVTVPPADPLIGVLLRAVTRPFASTLITGTVVLLPIFVCAVVMAANVPATEPGPVAVTSPVKAVIPAPEVDTATLESAVTRPLASTLITGTCVLLPMLLCAVVIAARAGLGYVLPAKSPPAAPVGTLASDRRLSLPCAAVPAVEP